jgi:hypothetical protein
MPTKKATKSKTKPKTTSIGKKSTGKKGATKKVVAKVTVKNSKPKSASKSTAATKSKNVSKITAKTPISINKIRRNNNGNGSRAILIEQTAYFIAEERGFSEGDPVQDWLAAERRVDKMLKENRV